MTRISRHFLATLKLNDSPAYRVAQLAGVNPSSLSQFINGIVPVRPDDPRIVAVGQVLGLRADECFEPEESMEVIDE